MEVRKTRTGLALITLGFVIGPAPFLYPVGGLLGVVGGIFLALARYKVDLMHHARIVSSIVLCAVGTLVGALGLLLLSSAFTNGPALLSAFTIDLTIFLIASIVAVALTGLAILLFTYSVQDFLGKSLLWAGYVISLGIAALTLIVVEYEMNAILEQACSSGLGCGPPSTSSLLGLQPMIQFLGDLGFLPAAINLFAYYRAWALLKGLKLS